MQMGIEIVAFLGIDPLFAGFAHRFELAAQLFGILDGPRWTSSPWAISTETLKRFSMLIGDMARTSAALPGNHRQAFEPPDQPALSPLPRHSYRYVDIKPVKVNIDDYVPHPQASLLGVA